MRRPSVRTQAASSWIPSTSSRDSMSTRSPPAAHAQVGVLMPVSPQAMTLKSSPSGQHPAQAGERGPADSVRFLDSPARPAPTRPRRRGPPRAPEPGVEPALREPPVAPPPTTAGTTPSRSRRPRPRGRTPGPTTGRGRARKVAHGHRAARVERRHQCGQLRRREVGRRDVAVGRHQTPAAALRPQHPSGGAGGGAVG